MNIYLYRFITNVVYSFSVHDANIFMLLSLFIDVNTGFDRIHRHECVYGSDIWSVKPRAGGAVA